MFIKDCQANVTGGCRPLLTYNIVIVTAKHWIFVTGHHIM